MSCRDRIRAVVAVLAACVAVLLVVRRERLLARELTAERAGHRLVDGVVQTDFEARLARLQAAVAAAPAAGSPSSASRSIPKEGGQW